ncbi:MAG TPA: chemotaxis protein CheB, partial [Caulobacteraceae bacterium]|nr:chemotaxis protein CheB [Caulobacteraceae bacterium]
VEADRTLSLSSDEPVQFSRPSIDVLFESAAEAYGARLVGVILTGANEDGADGLAAIAGRRGVALVEDPESAFATAMPSAALKQCAGAKAMSLDAIADYLVALGAA